jgi:hypothetical protein
LQDNEFIEELMESNTPPRQLSEVEYRLKQAQYYQLLLPNSFFEEDDVIARQVDNEVKEFINQRLSELLGLKESHQPQYINPFSEEEVETLKAIVAKVMDKPSLVKRGRKPKETPVEEEQGEEVNEAPPVKSIPYKSTTKSKPGPKARVNKVSVPEDVKESVPKEQYTKPVPVKPVLGRDPLNANSSSVQTLTLAPVNNVEVEENLGPGADGAVRIKKGNRFYKQSLDSNGVVRKNEKGEIILLDITPQGVSSRNKTVPMPTGISMTMATEQRDNYRSLKWLILINM